MSAAPDYADDEDESGMASDPLAMTEMPLICRRWIDKPVGQFGHQCGGVVRREYDGIYRCQECRYGYGMWI